MAAAKIANTTAPPTAWLSSWSTPPRKLGASTLNSPSREKARTRRPRRRRTRGDRRPVSEPGKPKREPLAVRHRLRDEDQTHGGDRQEGQVDLEHEHRRIWAVLGEESGDQRTEPQPAHVGGRRHHRSPPRGRARVGLGQRRRRGARSEPGREAGQDATDEEQAQIGSKDEHDRACGAQGQRREENRPSPHLVGRPTGQQQGGQDAGRVGGEDHGDDPGGEVPVGSDR